MELLSDPQAWVALVTLTVLEIVLGIDNIIFISILAEKLPAIQQARARTVGLLLAMFTRVGLLFSLSALMRLTDDIASTRPARMSVFIAGLMSLLLLDSTVPGTNSCPANSHCKRRDEIIPAPTGQFQPLAGS